LVVSLVGARRTKEERTHDHRDGVGCLHARTDGVGAPSHSGQGLETV
jgi:hypothetical protein